MTSGKEFTIAGARNKQPNVVFPAHVYLLLIVSLVVVMRLTSKGRLAQHLGHALHLSSLQSS